MNKPCIDCGTLTNASRCQECTPTNETQRHLDEKRESPKNRGYDRTWRNLSQRARQLQPWCTDCGVTTNLQLDHLPSAWERKAAHLPIRLSTDVEVVCGPCNAARGSSRPGTRRAQPGGRQPEGNPPRPPPVGQKSVT